MVFGAVGYGIAVLALLGLPETRGKELTMTNPSRHDRGHDCPLRTTMRRPHAWSPAQARARFRAGRAGPTAGGRGRPHPGQPDLGARGLGLRHAAVRQRNPKPCPVLDVTDAGRLDDRARASGADLRTDLPRYRVWEHGELVDEPTDVRRRTGGTTWCRSSSGAASPSSGR